MAFKPVAFCYMTQFSKYDTLMKYIAFNKNYLFSYAYISSTKIWYQGSVLLVKDFIMFYIVSDST